MVLGRGGRTTCVRMHCSPCLVLLLVHMAGIAPEYPPPLRGVCDGLVQAPVLQYRR